MHPQEKWFQYGRSKRTWPDLLSRYEGTITVTQEREQIVKVLLVDKRGFELTVRASLAQGGNVVSFQSDVDPPERPETSDPEAHYVVSWGEYEWKQHPTGVWYLSSCALRESNVGETDQPYFKWDLTVSDFDPSPKIPKNQFTFESFKLLAGTRVSESKVSGSRRWKVGEPPGTVAQPTLDKAARELKGKGFADPDRK